MQHWHTHRVFNKSINYLFMIITEELIDRIESLGGGLMIKDEKGNLYPIQEGIKGTIVEVNTDDLTNALVTEITGSEKCGTKELRKALKLFLFLYENTVPTSRKNVLNGEGYETLSKIKA